MNETSLAAPHLLPTHSSNNISKTQITLSKEYLQINTIPVKVLHNFEIDEINGDIKNFPGECDMGTIRRFFIEVISFIFQQVFPAGSTKRDNPPINVGDNPLTRFAVLTYKEVIFFTINRRSIKAKLKKI